jgi:hypothetical protein
MLQNYYKAPKIYQETSKAYLGALEIYLEAPKYISELKTPSSKITKY